ncbi:Gfo/Idh/MocA family oxidoreductase [Lewinella lacunae]|uniref:Gfo/Idh/MocA family oxidoreductase n=1 Tax=Neolewinella lacunae TaxID=1517758 RepID=A0A923T7W4_9BACT|nr:Gfo/Idh/MocA family oxidoreductase [Neolewinella lacunae]
MRFLIVGLGHIGRRHATLVAAHPAAEVVAICDVLPPRQLAWPEGVPAAVPLFAALEDFLAAGLAADVACICTPNGLHAAQAELLLRAGLHVVVEKPLALTVAGADAIIETARAAGRHVFGVMQNRYSPASAWLKEQLEQERLGEILQVHLNCFWNRDHRYYTVPPDGRPHPWHGDEALDGGVLFTQFAHFVDLLCWCFGPVEVASARFANQQHQGLHRFADAGTVHYSLAGGALGTLNFSTAIWDRNFESTLIVIGSKGTVKLGGQYMNEVRYCHVEGLLPPDLPASSPANNYGPYAGSAANHHFVIDNVIDVLHGKATVATTAEEGRQVVATIVAMYGV